MDAQADRNAPSKRPHKEVRERERVVDPVVEAFLKGPIVDDTPVVDDAPESLFAPPESLFAPPESLFAPPESLFEAPTAGPLFEVQETSLFAAPSLFAGAPLFVPDLWSKGGINVFGKGHKRRGANKLVRRLILPPPVIPEPERERWWLPLKEWMDCFETDWGLEDFIGTRFCVDFDEAITSQINMGMTPSDRLALEAIRLRPDDTYGTLMHEHESWEAECDKWDTLMDQFASLRKYLAANLDELERAIVLAQGKCDCANIALGLHGCKRVGIPSVDHQWAMAWLKEPEPDGLSLVLGAGAALLDHVAWFHPSLFGPDGRDLATLFEHTVWECGDHPPPVVQDHLVFERGLWPGTHVESRRPYWPQWDDEKTYATMRGSYFVHDATYYSAVGHCAPDPPPWAVIGWRFCDMARFSGPSHIHAVDEWDEECYDCQQEIDDDDGDDAA